MYIKGLLFCLEFELLGEQSCWFTFCQWRAEKSWLVTYFILSPHIRPLFMTSLRLLDTKWRHSRSLFSRLLRSVVIGFWFCKFWYSLVFFFLGNSPRPATQKLCEKELCAYFLYSNFPYGAIYAEPRFGPLLMLHSCYKGPITFGTSHTLPHC